MGVSWSRGCTNSVMLLSSKARKTKGSLRSCDLAEDTARNSPVKGSCLCWSTFPVTFTAREEPSGTSTSPEMARGRNPCRCLATCSWSVAPPPPGLSVSPDDLLGLVIRHAVHADGVHPGAGEVLAVEHREPAGITVQYSTVQHSTLQSLSTTPCYSPGCTWRGRAP